MITLSKIIYTVIWIMIWPALLLWLAGDWLWIEGWIFNLWFLTLCFTTILYLYRNDPALLAERYKQPGAAGQKGWDKYVVYGLTLGFIIWLIIIPLDAKRFAWTAGFPLLVKVLGGIGLLFSFFLFFRSYKDNTFVSPLVRIQAERKQKVVSTGVYGFIRHPMSLGGILLFLGAPLMLGSLYGVLIGTLLCFLLVARITGEEKMLVDQLEGYAGYKKTGEVQAYPLCMVNSAGEDAPGRIRTHVLFAATLALLIFSNYRFDAI
ncbi:MAG: isoprenylcysteine carboxylmethyltransferase family protein [Chloroflexi bacterium]|nr:isoprenylcysteine carboxylmethyltransferase family protein [Chloroflexota bacterium]